MALNDPPKVRGDGAISDRMINTILKDVFNRAADRLKGTAPVYVSTFDAQGRSLKRNRCTICAVALRTGYGTPQQRTSSTPGSSCAKFSRTCGTKSWKRP